MNEESEHQSRAYISPKLAQTNQQVRRPAADWRLLSCVSILAAVPHVLGSWRWFHPADLMSLSTNSNISNGDFGLSERALDRLPFELFSLIFRVAGGDAWVETAPTIKRHFISITSICKVATSGHIGPTHLGCHRRSILTQKNRLRYLVS